MYTDRVSSLSPLEESIYKIVTGDSQADVKKKTVELLIDIVS